MELQGQAIHNMGFETGTDIDSRLGADHREGISPNHAPQHLVVRIGHTIVCTPASCCLVQEE